MDPRVKTWLDRDPDPETRAELQKLVRDGKDAEIADRFRARLEFGTAGLRGVLGAGPNRMNRLVIRETSAGLAVYLLAQIPGAAERGVVVGYDGRRGSAVFAEDTAAVLAASGLRVHLFDRNVPTPVCAFAVRDLKAAAGVVVTASHNPPEYNGYKVYWENGAQIIPPHDSGIGAAIAKAAESQIPWTTPEKGRRSGKITMLGEETFAKYLAGVAALSIHEPSKRRAQYAIAYTPLHGVGAQVAEPALKNAGFENVHTVASQREPDGAFPTVRFPNPEEPGAMDAVMALAKKVGAELACANDPDADRFAVAVRDSKGSYQMLTGDQIGVLLGADRIAAAPKRGVVATTIVSSRLLGEIARSSAVHFVETLTGFKWIMNGALAAEADGFEAVFGYEEALGYSVGRLVRDKDGISALVSFCEMSVEAADQGKTVFDLLEALYRQHGLYVTAQKSIPLSAGTKRPSIGEQLRKSSPAVVAGRKVVSVTDIQQSERRFANGRRESLQLPKSDVLVYVVEGDARVIVRPSGTEPKIKCYYEVREMMDAKETFTQAKAKAEAQLKALIETHQREIAAL